jgi:hypothetical protein
LNFRFGRKALAEGKLEVPLLAIRRSNAVGIRGTEIQLSSKSRSPLHSHSGTAELAPERNPCEALNMPRWMRPAPIARGVVRAAAF